MYVSFLLCISMAEIIQLNYVANSSDRRRWQPRDERSDDSEPSSRAHRRSLDYAANLPNALKSVPNKRLPARGVDAHRAG